MSTSKIYLHICVCVCSCVVASGVGYGKNRTAEQVKILINIQAETLLQLCVKLGSYFFLHNSNNVAYAFELLLRCKEWACACIELVSLYLREQLHTELLSLIWVLRLELLSECWSRRIEWVSSILIWQHCELTRMCYRLTFSLPCRACMQRVAAKVPEPVSCIEKFNSRLCSSFSCWLCVGITLENLCFVTFWWNSKCFK